MDTVFAKAREMTLFNGGRHASRPRRRARGLAGPAHQFRLQQPAAIGPVHRRPNAAVTWGRVAGDALTKADAFLGKMGKPIGIQSYKPFQSTGEDFLHNYLGMIGIPIDLYPYFPTNANMVLLTECAKFDPDIVAKIKAQLAAGKSVVITSGLLRALQDKGIEDIAEIQYSDHKVLSHEYSSIFGAGNGSALAAEKEEDVLFPEIFFLTNDSWALLRAMANGRGYPLLLLNRYGKGILYVWTMPENFNDLYRLPQSAISTVKNYVMPGFPIRLDGPEPRWRCSPTTTTPASWNPTCPTALRRESLRGPRVHQTAQPGHRRGACPRPNQPAAGAADAARRRWRGADAALAEARLPRSTSICCPTATPPSSPSREGLWIGSAGSCSGNRSAVGGKEGRAGSPPHEHPHRRRSLLSPTLSSTSVWRRGR